MYRNIHMRLFNRRNISGPAAASINKRGKDVLKDAWFNKSGAFTQAERDRLGLRGLLPPRQLTIQQQTSRFLNHLRQPNMTMIDKFMDLKDLQDRNETLFYKIIIENIKEMAPIVHIPTVGVACKEFSAGFRSSRGMYFSLADRHECLPMVYNWPSDEVDVIVVTDGSRVIGMGDLGVQGMPISIGKLVLYVAAGGINPMRTLPVCIDVGTNNEELLNSPQYLGTPMKRCSDREYFELFDEFMTAVNTRWPNAMVQFADISNERAVSLLKKYRRMRLCFNDDIQGTGAMITAGVIGALRAQRLGVADLKQQRFVIVGAGSAGMGAASSLAKYMTLKCGLTREEARSRFWMVDVEGLLTTSRLQIGGKNLMPGQEKYLRDEKHLEHADLITIIREAQPTVLIGLSGVGGIFTPEVCEEMAAINSTPVIFAMSNPSNNAECTAETAFTHTEGRAIYASVNHYETLRLSTGKVCVPNQADNMFIYPGLGLGATVGKCKLISPSMIVAATDALVAEVGAEELRVGMVYPDLSKIRQVSLKIAVAVIMQAMSEGLTSSDIQLMSHDEVYNLVQSNMYATDSYPSIVATNK